VEYFVEEFDPAERAILNRYFTNIDGPVYALINLPEVVKGALFARYSRSAKSVRRLFLDEFVEAGAATFPVDEVGDPHLRMQRAEQLYDRVFFEYGDDSVAQLGGVHLACEQASNVLTKVLERGRLAAYLEQSTRYIAYDARLGARYRYHVPPELADSPYADTYVRSLNDLFETYTAMVKTLVDHYQSRYPQKPEDSQFVYSTSIKAKAYDTARGLLPAATLSNVGIYGSGQAYEMALLRMRAHPLQEVRSYADLMLVELRKVIPSFLKRVDLPDRGGAWSDYLASTAGRLEEIAAAIAEPPQPAELVTLIDFDPEAELKLTAAALYASSELSDRQLEEIARRMSPQERAQVVSALVGERRNRRHKPGRAMERSYYRFDVLCDFGAFRDLQRHRMMTIEWQRLTTRHGYDRPPELAEAGLDDEWDRAMDRQAELYEVLRAEMGADVAQYVVPFASLIRFVVEMNARQAFHLIELRSQPAGHPTYRRVVQEMHRQIVEVAGHRLIADAMAFVDYSGVDLERLDAERRAESRRRARVG